MTFAKSCAMLAVPVAVFTSCDPTTTGPLDGPGVYTATVSGDIAENLTGEASFGLLSDRNFEIRWGVILATGILGEETSDLIVLARRGTRRSPAPGTYTIIDERSTSTDSTVFVATYTHNRPPSRSTIFSSIQGTFTLAERSDSVAVGSFQIDATISSASGSPLGQQVSIQGTFSANPSVFIINPFNQPARRIP